MECTSGFSSLIVSLERLTYGLIQQLLQHLAIRGSAPRSVPSVSATRRSLGQAFPVALMPFSWSLPTRLASSARCFVSGHLGAGGAPPGFLG